jgi:hypothetical protein
MMVGSFEEMLNEFISEKVGEAISKKDLSDDVESALDNMDLSKYVEDALPDIENMVKDKINDYDFKDVIEDELNNHDFSAEIENEVECQLDNLPDMVEEEINSKLEHINGNILDEIKRQVSEQLASPEFKAKVDAMIVAKIKELVTLPYHYMVSKVKGWLPNKKQN